MVGGQTRMPMIVEAMEMVTESLPRKYRPKTLDEIVGQGTAVSAIKGFLKAKKVPPVLLLTGNTGTGKTTLARVIGNAVNRYKGDSDTNVDISEVNIGEERSIDDMRALLTRSKFLPQRKFRVIILDEIHQLPKAAASAMLKPLEEPHPQLVWILCTDQPEKLLDSILGRTFPIRLRNLQPEDVVPLLSRVVEAEKIELGSKKDKILLAIANTARAQPRASLQLLQSVSNLIQSGVKPSEALKQAFETLDIYRAEKVATKILFGVYSGKTNLTLSAIRDSDELKSVLHMTLDLNAYLLDLFSDTPKIYHSYARRNFRV
jgi:DNA polymerase III subunit gamma/tau